MQDRQSGVVARRGAPPPDKLARAWLYSAGRAVTLPDCEMRTSTNGVERTWYVRPVAVAVDPDEREVYVKAACLRDGRSHSVRVSRIVWIVDLDTGEVLEGAQVRACFLAAFEAAVSSRRIDGQGVSALPCARP
jgi:hypothetical protein